jgi:hypothetical protein
MSTLKWKLSESDFTLFNLVCLETGITTPPKTGAQGSVGTEQDYPDKPKVDRDIKCQ